VFIFHRFACNLDKVKWDEAGSHQTAVARAQRAPHRHEHEMRPCDGTADGPVNTLDEFLHHHFKNGKSGHVSFVVSFVQDLRQLCLEPHLHHYFVHTILANVQPKLCQTYVTFHLGMVPCMMSCRNEA
jgi:hypothetical protein